MRDRERLKCMIFRVVDDLADQDASLPTEVAAR
jgi:hypothetical protein